jgi:isocitrate dehydrogenase (NAD+)
MRTIAFIQGGGIGFEQEASVRTLLEALRVPLQLVTYQAGRAALDIGKDAMPAEALEAVRTNGVALKTKLLPPAQGKRVPVNFNIAFRRALGLYASVRPVHNVAGLPARFTGVNFLLVREITEDLYNTGEYEVVPGVVQSFKVATAAACMRFFKFAFELAVRTNRKTVHCIHKANILKMSDGLYLECFRRVAKEYPQIAAKDMIVDNACMQLVSKPTQFELMAAGNLYGDLLGDLGAGLVGGISATSAVNYGNNVTVYDAVYGAAHESVPPGRANPLPLLLPTIEMLKDLGEANAASRLLKAIEMVLTDGKVKPTDLGGSAGTEEFTAAIVAKL